MHAPLLQTEAIQMAPDPARKEQAVGSRVIAGPVDGLVRNRTAQILHMPGLRIIDQDVAARKALPEMVIVGDGHPCRMAGALIGGMRRHDQPAVRHKADGRMKFARADLAVVRKDNILHPKMLLHLPRFAVV